MKFLVDAQLPSRLARELTAADHDSIHTLDLALANRTTDADVTSLADREGRVVVTKDSDFVTSFQLHGQPRKLLLVSAGNIDNDSLVRLFTANLAALQASFAHHDFIELSTTSITIHV